MIKCAFCDCGRPLVRITFSRSDTRETLDVGHVCPECFADTDFMDLVGVGVISRDEEGVAHLGGRPLEEGP